MSTTKYYRVKPEHIEHYQMFLNCPTTGECIAPDSVVYKRLLQAKVLDIWCEEIKEKVRVKGWYNVLYGGMLNGPHLNREDCKQTDRLMGLCAVGQIYIDSEIEN